jgi:hypothetical protein
MSRKDSARYPNKMRKVQRRRRFVDAYEKQVFEGPDDPRKPWMTLSKPSADYGLPSGLLLCSHPDKGRALRSAEGNGAVSPSGLRELKSQVKELQRLLKRKRLENEILKEAIQAVRERGSSGRRHRR